MTDINIDAKEVIEWLRQRRKVKETWSQTLRVLRNKSKAYLESLKKKDIPEMTPLIAKLSSDKPLLYSDLQDLFNALVKSKEGEKKTFFGGYASETIKELSAIMKLMDREFVHAAGLAYDMSQMLTFDLPAVKRQLKSLNAEIADSKNKLGFFESSIASAKREIAARAAKLGGTADATSQLNHLFEIYAARLPSKLKTIVQAMNDSNCKALIENYVAFSIFNNDDKETPKRLEELRRLCEEGDLVVGLQGLEGPANEEFYRAFIAERGFGAETEIDTSDWDVAEGGVAQPIVAKKASLLTSREKREAVKDAIAELVCFLRARTHETENEKAASAKLSSSPEKDQLLLSFPPEKVAESLSELSKIQTLFEDPEFNDICLLLEDEYSKSLKILDFEKLRFLIQKNERNIVDCQKAIVANEEEKIEVEKKQKKIKREVVQYKNHLVSILESKFNAKFTINLPPL